MSLTDEEKAKRRIGGSMIAKILKKSRWGTPLDAYLELTGERPPEEKTGEDIDRGNFLEPALREWASKKTGLEFIRSEQVAYPHWEWATVNPDGLAIPSRTLLEIKAPRRDDILQWGEEGTDEVPTDALLQTHWGMLVTNADEGIVAALLGGELRIFRVARDLDLEAKMLAKAREFVERHVLLRLPPEPTFGDDANVLYRHPRNKKPHRLYVDLTPEEQNAVASYLAAYRSESEAADRLAAWEPVVKEMVGDTAGIDGIPPGMGKRIDWKRNASAGPAWKGVAEELLKKLPDEEQTKLISQFTPTEGPRVFRPYFNKEKK